MEKIKEYLKKLAEVLLNHDLFRIVVLVMVVLRTSAFLNPYVGPFIKFTIVWAVLILIRDLFKERLFLVNRYRLILYLFLIAYGVTAILNREENFARNVAMLGYLAVNMLVMYSYDVKRQAGEVKRQFMRLSHVFMAMSFVGQFISLVTFILNINFSYTIDGEIYYYGMYEGRLWGIFSNPNAASFYAVFCLMLTVICLMIWKGNTPRGWKIFYAVNMIVEALVFFLCDSRASLIAACVFLVVMPLLLSVPKLIRCWSDKKERSARIWKTLAVCIVLPVVLMSTHGFALEVMPNLVIKSEFAEQLTESIINSSEELAAVTSEETSEDVGRDFGTKFGGRYYLWQAGVEIAKKDPLFGVGFDNVPGYAYRYAARYYTNFGSKVYLPGISGGMHNLLFQLAASSGLIGLGLFVIFGVFVLVRTVRYYIWMVRNDRMNSIAIACIGMIVVILLRSMLDVGVVYGMYEQTVIFWTTMSMLMYFIDTEMPGGRRPLGAVIEQWIFGRNRDKGIPKLKFKPGRKTKK